MACEKQQKNLSLVRWLSGQTAPFTTLEAAQHLIASKPITRDHITRVGILLIRHKCQRTEFRRDGCPNSIYGWIAPSAFELDQLSLHQPEGTQELTEGYLPLRILRRLLDTLRLPRAGRQSPAVDPGHSSDQPAPLSAV